MTNTYNTGNPLGSTDPLDAYDNASNFDEFANSTERTYTDRLGVPRKTVTGALQDYAAYNSRGVWTTATAYNVNDVWRDGAAGAFYLVLADYTSGASAAADISGGNVVVHQPKDWVSTVTSVAEAQALAGLAPGQSVNLVDGGRSGIFDLVAGDFTAEVAADTLNGVYIAMADDPTGAVKCLVRRDAERLKYEWFDINDAVDAVTWGYSTATDLTGYPPVFYATANSRDDIVKYNDIAVASNTFCVIKLKPPFAAWTAATTDINFGRVAITSDFPIYIDATGIPDVAGNYWMKCTGRDGFTAINNIRYQNKTAMENIVVRGPGNSSNVIFRVFDGFDNMDTKNVQCLRFGFGDQYRDDAYLITHYDNHISRCGVHVDMPSGYTNYGENIKYVGGVIATSAGTAVRNNNNNGEIKLVGVSIDYTGKIFEANAGTISAVDCHIEFNNATTPLTGIPFTAGNTQTSKINIVGGEVWSFSTLNQPYCFDVGELSMGVFVKNARTQGLVTTTGRLKTGNGRFDVSGSTPIDGNGNMLLTVLSDSENKLSDGGFESGTISEWFVWRDTAAITSRTAGKNLTLSADTASPNSGTYHLKAEKSFGSGSIAELACIVPVSEGGIHAHEFYIRGYGSASGSVPVTGRWVCVEYFDQYGIPVVSRDEAYVTNTTFNASTQTWTKLASSPIRRTAPRWATHYMIRINLNSVSSTGSDGIYVDDVIVCAV